MGVDGWETFPMFYYFRIVCQCCLGPDEKDFPGWQGHRGREQPRDGQVDWLGPPSAPGRVKVFNLIHQVFPGTLQVR
jgi:hypothetical protein